MLDTIGITRIHSLAAEVEIRFSRMAHRPATYFLGQVEQAGLVRNLRARLGRYKAARWRGRDRCLLIAWSLAQESAGADRNDLGQIRRRVGNGLGRDR